MDDLHEVVSKLKALNESTGKVPNRAEFEASGVSCAKIRRLGGYNRLLDLAGLVSRKFKISKKIKILILDIETAPIEVRVWRLGKQVVTIDQIVEGKDWFIMCWAAKWMGSKRVFFADQSNKPDMRNDAEIVTELRNLINEADIVISQNGISFDLPKIMARAFKWKLGPVKKFRH